MSNSYFERRKQDIAKHTKIAELCKAKGVIEANLTIVLASKYNVKYPCQLEDEQLEDFRLYLEKLP